MNLRDLNLEFKGNTKLPVTTCVKTMRTSSCLRILHPVAFSFKEERFLATELSSSEGVWLVRKGEKMREKRENKKEWEELKLPAQKIY